MSNNFDFLKKSEIRDMSIECEKVEGINLSQGICDFPLNKVLVQGLTEAVQQGFNHYTRHDGEQILREAVEKKAEKYNKIYADSNRNIIITSGTTGALYCVCAALFKKSDEIILFEPYYGYHKYTLLSFGIKPVYIQLTAPKWEIDFDQLERSITSKTKAIIINTPLNPSGKIFTYEELIKLSEICERKNLLVITDEIYEYIIYDGYKHISPASLLEFNNRVITISGYSKTFSITGWRIGYCICPEEYTEKIGNIADLVYVCPPAPLQRAVAKAINELEEDFYQDLINKFTYKRQIICNTLKEVGLTPFIPQGAYYVMHDISIVPGKDSKEKVMWLLKNTGIAVVPGEAFYDNPIDGNNIARLCFAKDDIILHKACKILNRVFR